MYCMDLWKNGAHATDFGGIERSFDCLSAYFIMIYKIFYRILATCAPLILNLVDMFGDGGNDARGISPVVL